MVYAPSIIKDPNTGALSGVFYDLTEHLGQKLNLKVEWTEEVNFGSMLEGLKSGRYDQLCLNGWDTAHLAPYVANARPLFYSVINVFVRADDPRFDGHQNALNDPAVRFSAIDGNGTTVIARQTFPRATLVSLPQDTDYSLAIQNVVNGKADAVLVENALAARYVSANLGKIRQVQLGKPLRYYANSYPVDVADYRLMNMLNAALNEMVGSGEVDEIVMKYNTASPPSFLLVAPPYRLPGEHQ